MTGLAGVVTAVAGATAAGVALAEVYGLDGSARLANISARGGLEGSGGSLTVGFVVAGGSKRVLVRALGPVLAVFGVAGVVADPALTVYDSAGRALAQNDNWETAADIASATAAAGTFPLTRGSKDAAVIVTLAPGAYTAQATGATAGATAVEIYELP